MISCVSRAPRRFVTNSQFAFPVQRKSPIGVLFTLTRLSHFAASLYFMTHRTFSTASIISSNVVTNNGPSFINSKLAKSIDIKLMSQPGFSIDQLMELAGYSVACAAHELMRGDTHTSSLRNVLIFCGPGNNGGDGLVAARHLVQFGYSCTVVYPKRSKGTLFDNLVQLCEDVDISVLDSVDVNEYSRFGLIIDAMFGFSFEGPPRNPFADIIDSLSKSSTPVLSVDIPSGWNVDEGDVYATGFTPHAVISLTLPKLCMKGYRGIHYIGGRFVSAKLARELQVTLPDYGFGTAQITRIIASEDKDKECEESASTDVTAAAALSNKDASVNDKKTDEALSVMFATASSSDEARQIARSLVEKRLVACVNLVPGVESVYEWEGQVESSQEILLMIKTRKANIASVSDEIKRMHSYTLPESIALDIVGGSAEYLDWVRSNSK